MTGRKPAPVPWHNWIDEQIRQAEADGAFDNLPGKGKPIPDLDKPYDEMWWVKSWMKREGLQHLPETLQVRLDLERALTRIASLGTEDGVRREAKRINARIIEVNRTAIDGPPSELAPLDVDALLDDWRTGRLAERVEMIRDERRGTTPKPAPDREVDRPAVSPRDWTRDFVAPSTPVAAAGSASASEWPAMRYAVWASLILLGLTALLVTSLVMQ